MALNPVETLNVFRSDLQEELRNRSKSHNLLRTRTPFIRFTTATDMSNITTALNAEYQSYQNCRFFTLGLHGWDNLSYNVREIYGTKADTGLVVGTTYNQQSGNQFLISTKSVEMARNYPPPGITSAKVERVRSGNVLKFTINIQCHTQEQLELLDILCLIPGMTCILEWGTQATTSTGTVKLNPILDFKNSQVEAHIRDAIRGPRSNIINTWCAPNKFNYDWAVANIANVKTSLEDNIYKISVIAYGRADNLLYISAYATSNPLTSDQVQSENVVIRSINEYFTVNGEFSTFLRDNASIENRNTKVLKFRSEVNQEELKNVVPQEMDTGNTNDVGYEDAYFIKFTAFIEDIINGRVMNIINSALSTQNRVSMLIAPLDTSGDNQIKVGYNQFLRSTSPETMIIYNETARAEAAKRTRTSALKSGVISQLGNENSRVTIGVGGRINTAEGQGGLALSTASPIGVLHSSPFGKELAATQPSGLTSFDGVWLNSKAIQSAFLNARTIMEGMETLLRNINAATENYWDLKLFWDDEQQAFRILDDNARDPNFSTEQKIYEFNKKIDITDDNAILGPDVLNIEVNTDYPKMLFSQLAVSGINGGNLVSDQRRRDIDFVRNTSLTDIFSTGATSPRSSGTRSPARVTETLSVPQLSDKLAKALYGNTENATRSAGGYSDELTQVFSSGVPTEISNLLIEIFENKGLLTVGEASGYRSRFETAVQNGLTEQQSVAIINLLGKRAEAIIRGLKRRETEILTNAFTEWRTTLPNSQNTRELITQGLGSINIKIKESEDRFVEIINGAVRTGATEEQRKAQQRSAEQAAVNRLEGGTVQYDALGNVIG